MSFAWRLLTRRPLGGSCCYADRGGRRPGSGRTPGLPVAPVRGPPGFGSEGAPRALRPSPEPFGQAPGPLLGGIPRLKNIGLPAADREHPIALAFVPFFSKGCPSGQANRAPFAHRSWAFPWTPIRGESGAVSAGRTARPARRATVPPAAAPAGRGARDLVPGPQRRSRHERSSGRGVVAGIGVDEHGTARVQCHGHPARGSDAGVWPPPVVPVDLRPAHLSGTSPPAILRLNLASRESEARPMLAVPVPTSFPRSPAHKPRRTAPPSRAPVRPFQPQPRGRDLRR